MDPVTLRVASALAFAVSAFALFPANAQTLTTLHVRTFTMSADPAASRVGDTFRLTIAAHVDERIVELDNVTLPDLSGFDVLGDERRCSAGVRGSDCIETLNISPTVAGDRTIAATIMDAVDGRNGKPSRFSTNTVAVRVADAPPHLPSWIVETLWAFVLTALPAAAAAFVIYVLLRQFGKRRTAARPRPAVPIRAPLPVDRNALLVALVAALANEPTRARALAVRAALRERVDARDDETLADIAHRYRDGTQRHLLAALCAIERPSFCEDARVARAVEEALPSLNF